MMKRVWEKNLEEDRSWCYAVWVQAKDSTAHTLLYIWYRLSNPHTLVDGPCNHRISSSSVPGSHWQAAGQGNSNEHWPLHSSATLLTSCKPLCSDNPPPQWRDNWESASVVNCAMLVLFLEQKKLTQVHLETGNELIQYSVNTGWNGVEVTMQCRQMASLLLIVYLCRVHITIIRQSTSSKTIEEGYWKQ